MDENKALTVIGEAKEVAVEVYKDAAQPIIRPIGEILSFLPRTIKLALSGWEKWLINGEESLKLTAEAIREKVKTIPEEKLVEPEPYVAIPAIQQISYCQNSEELRELYANLIAASMNSDTKWKVHPSFVDIIKQLNPDEARYIMKLFPDVVPSYPIIDLQYYPGDNNNFYTSITNFTNVNIDILEFPDNICSYIDNLERLKIIEIPPNICIVPEDKYKVLENHSYINNYINTFFHVKEPKFKFNHKCFKLTSFGVNLIRTIK